MSAPQQGRDRSDDGGRPARRAGDEAEARRPRRISLSEAADSALREFARFTGLTPEGISGARPEGGGWSLLVDVRELERVPDTTSVMATYRVDVDRHGHIESYERLRRFVRSATDQS